MKNQLFEDLIESIKELPTEILEKMRINMKCEYCDDTGTIYGTKCGACNDVPEEQMRKEFEAWAANHYWLREFGPERNLGNLDEYLDSEVQLAWEAFKASRESLVVELPEAYYGLFEDCRAFDECDIKEALEQQGIKWK